MTELFFVVLNRCISAGWMIIAVLMLRFLLRSTPRKYFVIMWLLVGVRMLLPFSIKSPISLVPQTENVYSYFFEFERQSVIGTAGLNSDLNAETAENIGLAENDGTDMFNYKEDGDTLHSGALAFQESSGEHGIRERILGNMGELPGMQRIDEERKGVDLPDYNGAVTGENILLLATSIWGFGMAVMFIKLIIGCISVKRSIKVSSKIEKGIYLCDYIGTSFVIGLINPRIYVPSGMEEMERSYVIKHELAHIKRMDHIWKLVGYLLLTVCWFQPLMWVAYHFMCKDIEFACDELVISKLDKENRINYAKALLNNSISDHVSVVQLAIGDTGVKERIVNIMNYKNKKILAAFAGAACCVLLAACLVTDPSDEAGKGTGLQSESLASLADSATSEATSELADAMTESSSDPYVKAGTEEAIEGSDDNISDLQKNVPEAKVEVVYEEAAKGHASEELVDRTSFISEYYNENDFDTASKAVMAFFYQSMPYCELKELYYPGDEETNRQDRYAENAGPGTQAYTSHKESMVLRGSYITGEKGKISPALNPNAEYPNWSWILCRTEDGGWEVKDQGY